MSSRGSSPRNSSLLQCRWKGDPGWGGVRCWAQGMCLLCPLDHPSLAAESPLLLFLFAPSGYFPNGSLTLAGQNKWNDAWESLSLKGPPLYLNGKQETEPVTRNVIEECECKSQLMGNQTFVMAIEPTFTNLCNRFGAPNDLFLPV